MGQYKVPQNVEAEDKIIGPLTLKQFIYTVVGLVYGFTTFFLLKSFPIAFILVGVPPTLMLLLLGLYQRRDQNFETLFFAMLSFFTKPRKRLWDKEPIEEVFRIQQPPPAIQTAAGRDPEEVRGQLERLAQIVDNRGWAPKQAALQEPATAPAVDLGTRIVAPAAIAIPAYEPADVSEADDILDFAHNPAAQAVNQLVEGTAKNIREEAMAKVKGKQPATVAASTSAMPSPAANAILKSNLAGSGLKVSQIASQVNKANTLAEGKPVNLRNGK